MTDVTRYGLIGCGMMGQEHLRNIALLPGTDVVALMEPDDAMARDALALAPSAIRYNTLLDMLDVADLDALVIASPNFRHVEQVAEIAARRPLPLLVEKPLYTDPADLPRVKALFAAYPAPVWVAMEYRYMPPITAFLDRLEAATGGVQMLSIREHRFPFLQKVGNWNRFNRYTGGTFVEKCCHFFDLMRFALQSEPTRIWASASAPLNHQSEDYRGETPDILDAGYAICEFESGARAMLELCMYAEGARYQEELSAVGPDGKIEVFVPGPGRFWPSDLGAAPLPFVQLSPRHPKRPETLDVPVDPSLLEAGDHNGATFYQHQKFLEVIRGQAQPEVTAYDGWRAVEMGLAAQRAIKTGLPVSLHDPASEISA